MHHASVIILNTVCGGRCTALFVKIRLSSFDELITVLIKQRANFEVVFFLAISICIYKECCHIGHLPARTLFQLMNT